jgi:hypothetical protein
MCRGGGRQSHAENNGCGLFFRWEGRRGLVSLMGIVTCHAEYWSSKRDDPTTVVRLKVVSTAKNK